MQSREEASVDSEPETPPPAQSTDVSRRSRESLSMVSHDLRTPLAAIRMNVQLFKKRWIREAPTPRMMEEGLDRLAWLTERTLAMVEDVIAVNAARVPAPPVEAADLEDAIHEAILMQKELLERSRCTVRVTRDVDGTRMSGAWHRGLLLRLFLNLLDNVSRHAPGAPVTITLFRQERWARVLFSDEGPGLPDEPGDLHDGSPRRAGHRGGHGLGLWIVHRIAIDLGGELATLNRPGVGLTFDIRLPL
ncbi:MAG: HAMP domain-containing sensor histidine kinase [Myxococcales bacterium]